MQFSEKLEIWDCSIGDVKVKNSNGTFAMRIDMRGQLTPELAAILGCRSAVYAENGTPHEGFTSIEDSTAGCAAFRALLTVDGLKQELEINGDKVDDVYVEKIGKNGQLRLSLRMHYTGDPLVLINYWKLVGGAAGVCKITPLQQELEAADTVEAEIVTRDKATGEVTRTPVPKETLRKAVGASKRVQ